MYRFAARSCAKKPPVSVSQGMPRSRASSGEHAAAQTQKLRLAGFVQLAEQPEHMGARAPGVAAADEMYGFHGGPPMTADKFRSLLSCPAGADCGILTLT